MMNPSTYFILLLLISHSVSQSPGTDTLTGHTTGANCSDPASNCDAKSQSLEFFTVEDPAHGNFLTNNFGVRESDDNNTEKAGDRGPSLLEDIHFREKIMHFDH